MRRLITAGCSFTSYTPVITWPIFLSELFDETYNYGQTGAGNKFIFNAIIEADTELKLTSDDLVIVAWSGFFRHDSLITEPLGMSTTRYWKTSGDWHYWHLNSPIKEPLLYEYLTNSPVEDEYIHMTHTYMLALSRYLKAKNIPYLFTSLEDCRGVGCLLNNEYGELEELYDDKFIMPKGLIEQVKEWNTRLEKELGYFWGAHPSNSVHYKIAETIAKELGFSISCHDDLLELDRLTVSEEAVCRKNIDFDSHKLYLKCLSDISPDSFTSKNRTAFKYHRNTLSIHKQILKDICR